MPFPAKPQGRGEGFKRAAYPKGSVGSVRLQQPRAGASRFNGQRLARWGLTSYTSRIVIFVPVDLLVFI
jgi:hypothetical protein